MSKNYTITAASLKATIADIRRLNANEISLNGKNILDYVGSSGFDSYDTRDPQLKNDELDIWNANISLSDNEHIEVKPKEHKFASLSAAQKSALRGAVKVVNNEVYGAGDEHIMYWQTDGITHASGMFDGCVDLLTFDSDLSNLSNGSGMFMGSSIASFDRDLPKLDNGSSMFRSCTGFTSFDVYLPALYYASAMFMDCPQLTSFTSDLRLLKYGLSMFGSCKLDAQSVANIVHSLPNRNGEITDIATGFGCITIGIGCDNTEADRLLFAQECDCDTWQELLDDFTAKNWRVEFQCNGRPTSTYNMRRGETLSIYTMLEEVADDEHYQYTSQDGTKRYNIRYFHSTNDSSEGYDVFSSLEEAISTYNVIAKN